jgi:hypothetical protein
MLNLLHNWRTTLWIGLPVFLVFGGLIPQVGALLLAAWWTECQGVGMACWPARLPVCRCTCTGRRRQAQAGRRACLRATHRQAAGRPRQGGSLLPRVSRTCQ